MNSPCRKALVYATVACTSLLFWDNRVRAQQGSADQGIQEILVTARKVKESILDVPVIETAVPAKELSTFQTIDMYDLPALVPGLILGNNVHSVGTQVSIRGIGTSTSDQGADESVSLNIDGMSLGNGLAYSSGLFDLDQIEVLKGPQNLFFGPSNTGGVISLRTADPTNEFEVIGRESYEFEAMTAREEAIISGPVSDTLKLRLATMYSTSEGYYFNDAVALPNTGALNPTYPRAQNSRDYIVRGTALWNPIDTFDARIKLNYVNDYVIDADAFQIASCPDGAGFAPSGIPFIGGDNCQLDRYQRLVYMNPAYFPGLMNNGVPFTNYSQKYGIGELNYHPSQDLTLTSVTAYYYLNEHAVINPTDTTEAAPAFAVENFYTRRLTTEELRLNSTFSTPVNFMIGGLYQDGQFSNKAIRPGNSFYHFPALLSANLIPVTVKSNAAFGQLRWKIVPQLELAAGVRWTDEERNETVFNLAKPIPTPVPVPVDHIQMDNTAPEVTLTYKPAADLTLFAALKKAYKSGSFSVATIPVAGASNAYGPEKAEGGEGGIKGLLLDHQLALDVAGYYYRYTGLQSGVVEPAVNGIPEIVTVNAGSARSFGIDADIHYHPDSIRALTLNGAVLWNNARYIQLNNVPCWGGQTIALGCTQFFNSKTGLYTAQNLDGTPLLRAPLWQLNAGFDYEIAVAQDYKLVLGNNTAFLTQYATFLAIGRPNNDNFQTSFAKVDLSLRLQAPDNRWEIALIGKNITGKITAGTCNSANLANGSVLGGQITGGTGRGPAGIDEVGCFPDPGREVWLRLSWRPFAQAN